MLSQLLQNFSSAELFHSHSCFITIYHQKMHYYFPATGDIPAAGADYSSSMEFTVFQQLSKIPAGWLVGDFQQASVYSGTAWYPVSQQGGKTGPLPRLEKTGF